jgi:hypothetical protein
MIEHGDPEICKEHPGFNEDLYITAETEAFVKRHAGQLAWAEGRANQEAKPRWR